MEQKSMNVKILVRNVSSQAAGDANACELMSYDNELMSYDNELMAH